MAKYICIDIYKVQSGDTLYTIAQNYEISVELLMAANKIRNPYNLQIGEELCIPGILPENNPSYPGPPPEKHPSCPVMPPPGQRPQPGPMPQPEPKPQPTPMPHPGPNPIPERPRCNGRIYTVIAGDTLYMIAKRFGVSLDSIIESNPNVDMYNLTIGTPLCIPGTR